MSTRATGDLLTDTRAELPVDLPAPIIVLARGHSGTRALARILEAGGVYVGSSADPTNLNATHDALHWVYAFQSELTPRFFEYGRGCRLDSGDETAVRVVHDTAGATLRRHLDAYESGRWGLKTGGAMFCFDLYDHVFPDAKYVYMVRDGRDVTLSHRGYFHLTNPRSREKEWDLFKLITFGISDDIDACPFEFPASPAPDDEVMRHRYWIQARSWCEHVRMMEHLQANDRVGGNTHLVRYEDLCREPARVLTALFDFLEVDLDRHALDFAAANLHTGGIDRWRDAGRYVEDTDEDLGAVFESMAPELGRLGYV
jgi:hypothetical protein